MKLRTNTWEITHLFKHPVPAENIKLVESALELPRGIDDLIKENYRRQLLDKKAALADSGEMEIRPYHKDARFDALYQGEKTVIWPGPILSVKAIEEAREEVRLYVAQTVFPIYFSMKDPRVEKCYEEQGVSKPKPLGLKTFAVASDGEIVLTVRGEKIARYPNRISSQSGAPESVSETILSHQQNETEEEICVKPTEYEPSGMAFGGIAEYLVDYPGQINLLGWVKLKIDSEEIFRRVYSPPIEQRPKDAVGVIFAPSQESQLYDYLTKRVHEVQFTPTTLAGLVVYGHHAFGKEWTQKVIKKLPEADNK